MKTETIKISLSFDVRIPIGYKLTKGEKRYVCAAIKNLVKKDLCIEVYNKENIYYLDKIYNFKIK